MTAVPHRITPHDAARIRAAADDLRNGNRTPGVLMPDGTFISPAAFEQQVALARHWIKKGDAVTVEWCQEILAIEADRQLAALKARPTFDADDDRPGPVWGWLFAFFFAVVLSATVYAIIMGLSWLVETTRDATLAQAEQAAFIEYSPEVHQ